LKVLAAVSREEAARRAAEEIAAVLRRPGRPAVVLSTGRTMVPVFLELVRLHRKGRAPFARALAFQVDELRVPRRDRSSFGHFLKEHLYRKVGLPGRRIHELEGGAGDAGAECARYERELRKAGGGDLVVLGIGANGHVAYLEPGRALAPRTSRVRLSAATRRGLAASGLKPPPREALTMGIETILSARRVLLVAFGRSKAAAVSRAISGRISARCPASYLTLHPRLTVILDRQAASSLWLSAGARRTGPGSRRGRARGRVRA
jgi:glucosamine-6-phosphate deaminase